MIISEQCTDSETEPKRVLTVKWKCYQSVWIWTVYESVTCIGSDA